MSLAVMTWVLDESEVSGGPRWVLFVLAEHAHDDGRESYPAVDTIARRARLSRRAVQEGLRRLERDGAIERDGVGPRGQTKWRVVMGGAESAPGADDGAGGRRSRRQGGAPPAPEPSLGTVQGTSGTRTRAADPDELPPGFPPDLGPMLDEVVATLSHVVEVRGGRPVARAAVARAMVKRPRKPHALVAERVEHWLLYGRGSRRPTSDVVARWRDWCDDEPDLVPGQPRPEVAAAGNVRPLRPTGRSTAADYQALKGRLG